MVLYSAGGGDNTIGLIVACMLGVRTIPIGMKQQHVAADTTCKYMHNIEHMQ